MLVLEVFLSVLFVMSGIDLWLRKFVSILLPISVLEEVEGVKLKQGTVVALKYKWSLEENLNTERSLGSHLTPEFDDLVCPLINFLISELPSV